MTKERLSGLDLVLGGIDGHIAKANYDPRILRLLTSSQNPLLLAQGNFNSAVSASGLKVDRVYRTTTSGSKDSSILSRELKATKGVVKAIKSERDKRRLTAVSVGLETIAAGLAGEMIGPNVVYDSFEGVSESRHRRSLESWEREFADYNSTFNATSNPLIRAGRWMLSGRKFHPHKQKHLGQSLEKLLVMSYLLDLHIDESKAQVAEQVLDAYRTLRNYITQDAGLIRGHRRTGQRDKAIKRLIEAENNSKGSVKSRIKALRTEVERKIVDYDTATGGFFAKRFKRGGGPLGLIGLKAAIIPLVIGGAAEYHTYALTRTVEGAIGSAYLATHGTPEYFPGQGTTSAADLGGAITALKAHNQLKGDPSVTTPLHTPQNGDGSVEYKTRYTADGKVIGGTQPEVTLAHMNETRPFFADMIGLIEDQRAVPTQVEYPIISDLVRTVAPLIGQEHDGVFTRGAHAGVEPTMFVTIPKRYITTGNLGGGSSLAMSSVGVLSGNATSGGIWYKLTEEIPQACALNVHLDGDTDKLVTTIHNHGLNWGRIRSFDDAYFMLFGKPTDDQTTQFFRDVYATSTFYYVPSKSLTAADEWRRGIEKSINSGGTSFYRANLLIESGVESYSDFERLVQDGTIKKLIEDKKLPEEFNLTEEEYNQLISRYKTNTTERAFHGAITRAHSFMELAVEKGYVDQWIEDGKLPEGFQVPTLEEFIPIMEEQVKKGLEDKRNPRAKLPEDIYVLVTHELKQKGLTDDQITALKDSGAVIELSYNQEVQSALYDAVMKQAAIYDHHFAFASVMIDAKTGEIEGIVSRSDYDPQHAYHLGIRGSWQLGSAMKPHIVAAAGDISDIPLEDLLVLNTAKISPRSGFGIKGGRNWRSRGSIIVSEYGDQPHIPAEILLAKSQNTANARLLYFKPFEEGNDVFRKMIARANGVPIISEDSEQTVGALSKVHTDIAFAFGTDAIPLVNLGLGYTPFVSVDGKGYGERPQSAHMIRQILMPNNEGGYDVLYTASQETVRAYSPASAQFVGEALKGTVASGGEISSWRGTAAKIGIPTLGFGLKTLTAGEINAGCVVIGNGHVLATGMIPYEGNDATYIGEDGTRALIGSGHTVAIPGQVYRELFSLTPEGYLTQAQQILDNEIRGDTNYHELQSRHVDLMYAIGQVTRVKNNDEGLRGRAEGLLAKLQEEDGEINEVLREIELTVGENTSCIDTSDGDCQFKTWDSSHEIPELYIPPDRWFFWPLGYQGGVGGGEDAEIVGRISSWYGKRRTPKGLKPKKSAKGGKEPHGGVDLATQTGTPIYASADGIITRIGPFVDTGGYGNLIEIYHGPNEEGQLIETRYAHASAFEPGIAEGSFVEAGQKIAEVGSTGRSTGPHLHYEIRVNGKTVNPCGNGLNCDPNATN